MDRYDAIPPQRSGPIRECFSLYPEGGRNNVGEIRLRVGYVTMLAGYVGWFIWGGTGDRARGKSNVATPHEGGLCD